MDAVIDLIRNKRDGEELVEEEYERLINGYTRNEIQDSQMASFLMAGYCRGFTDTEATALTSAMLHCGQRPDMSDVPSPRVDKHFHRPAWVTRSRSLPRPSPPRPASTFP